MNLLTTCIARRIPFGDGLLIFFAFLALGMAEHARAGDDLALVGGKIYTAAGQVHEDGIVVIRAGRIAAVGPRSQTPVPPGVPVLSASGRAVIPGLVDLWSDLPQGASAGGQPDFRSGDLVEPFPEAWQGSLSEGITTVAVAPSQARGVGGLGTVLKLRSARKGEILDIRFRRDSHLLLALGMVPPGMGAPR